MLVYFRQADIDTIVFHVGKSQIPQHLTERFDAEQNQEKKLEQERKKERLCIISFFYVFHIPKGISARVAMEKDMMQNSECDLVSWDNVDLKFRLKRAATPQEITVIALTTTYAKTITGAHRIVFTVATRFFSSLALHSTKESHNSS